MLTFTSHGEFNDVRRNGAYLGTIAVGSKLPHVGVWQFFPIYGVGLTMAELHEIAQKIAELAL